jgi:hypothetical protein
LQEEDVNMQQLSLQRPTMRGDNLRGSIFAPAIPARVHHMSSSDGAMLGPEPILSDHAAQMPFNLQQSQALSEAAAGESILWMNRKKPISQVWVPLRWGASCRYTSLSIIMLMMSSKMHSIMS